MSTYIKRIGNGGEIVPLFFVGIWSSGRPKDQLNAEWLEIFTILTREAYPELQRPHSPRSS